QLARLEYALLVRERFVARGPDREIVGKDRRALAEHDDAAALVIGRDKQTATERRFEVVQQLGVLLRRFEVSAVQDEPGGTGLAKQGDIGIGQLGAGEAEHELLADEGLEVFFHRTIIGRRTLGARDLRKRLFLSGPGTG